MNSKIENEEIHSTATQSSEDLVTNNYQSPEKKIVYASFDRRLISFTIDVATIFLLIHFIQTIHNIFWQDNLTEKMNHFFIEYGGQKNGMNFSTIWNYMVEQGVLYAYIMWQFIVPFSIMTGYVMISWIKFSGITLGKFFTKTQIVDVKTFKNPTKLQYFVRFISYPLLILTLGIGMVIISFRKDRRGLHDLISNTAVIIRSSKKIINSSII